jgi:transposase, IS30 family
MPRGYHHLTRDQRCQLAALKNSGKSASDIANDFKVDRSTIYRELTRTPGKYEYQQAHSKYLEEKKKSPRNAKMTPELIATVEDKLKLQWSPEQISGWLKRNSDRSISHETIYKHIWADKKKGGNLYKQLRHCGKKYNKRSSDKAGRGCIPGRIDIAERPPIVETKERLGDWEIDTIIGSEHKGVIVSMVERHSKFTYLAKASRKTAEEVEKALTQTLNEVKDVVLTITADNGKEFANHRSIAEKLEASVYFARPYHSWERGLNEHTNGLVRQYLPKQMRLDGVTEQTLREIEHLLNNRPRKILQFRTPEEVFQEKRKLCLIGTRQGFG